MTDFLHCKYCEYSTYERVELIEHNDLAHYNKWR